MRREGRSATTGDEENWTEGGRVSGAIPKTAQQRHFPGLALEYGHAGVRG